MMPCDLGSLSLSIDAQDFVMSEEQGEETLREIKAP